MTRGKWLTAAFLSVLAAVIVVGWALTEPAPPPTIVANPTVVSDEALCREYGKAALVMADELDKAFKVHADAHMKYRKGLIPMGPADKPGTVLYIWAKTLHARSMHAVHYHEMRDAWRHVCLTDPPAPPDQ